MTDNRQAQPLAIPLLGYRSEQGAVFGSLKGSLKSDSRKITGKFDQSKWSALPASSPKTAEQPYDFSYTTSRRPMKMKTHVLGADTMPSFLSTMPSFLSISTPPANFQYKARPKSSMVNTAAWKAYGSPKLRGISKEAPVPDRMHPNPKSSVIGAMSNRQSTVQTLGGGYQVVQPTTRPHTAPMGGRYLQQQLQPNRYIVGPKLEAPPKMRRPATASCHPPSSRDQMNRDQSEEYKFSETLPSDPVAMKAWLDMFQCKGASLGFNKSQDVTCLQTQQPAPPSSFPSRPTSARSRPVSGRTSSRPERFQSLTLKSVQEEGINYRPLVVAGYSDPLEEVVIPDASDTSWTYSRLSVTSLTRICNNLKLDPTRRRPYSAPAQHYAPEANISPSHESPDFEQPGGLYRHSEDVEEWFEEGVKDAAHFDRAMQQQDQRQDSLPPPPQMVHSLEREHQGEHSINSNVRSDMDTDCSSLAPSAHVSMTPVIKGIDSHGIASMVPEPRVGRMVPDPEALALLYEDGFVQEDDGDVGGEDEVEAAIIRITQGGAAPPSQAATSQALPLDQSVPVVQSGLPQELHAHEMAVSVLPQELHAHEMAVSVLPGDPATVPGICTPAFEQEAQTLRLQAPSLSEADAVERTIQVATSVVQDVQNTTQQAPLNGYSVLGSQEHLLQGSQSAAGGRVPSIQISSESQLRARRMDAEAEEQEASGTVDSMYISSHAALVTGETALVVSTDGQQAGVTAMEGRETVLEESATGVFSARPASARPTSARPASARPGSRPTSSLSRLFSAGQHGANSNMSPIHEAVQESV
ncbi:hypothetical protein CEUSTIGMA_g1505.t1 [Chlamydomonas eustigma]|uniref:Uncharacterized protein n=1 Tax=Chlamydomonas eustigma TaxID=1157962 RepID=A0A250WTC0_9CHLO|nr:hypothetical protein CEUSTIGMA_g1505.t1 [Chlamydomonas eustigma]|eukprot:GAX74055.1 hypothetical protein CEUSTIGMA_g1505.t1 [Chlamydomonas eustigma]